MMTSCKPTMKWLLVFLLWLSFTVGVAVCANADTYTRADDSYAKVLNGLGLFSGTDNGFELEKKLARDEAAVMLVRLLGSEDAALAGTYSLPFSDVDQWAMPYVGWLYEKKLLYGLSDSEYGSKNNITGQQYMTFLLRCLGYSDGDGGDFKYDGVFEFVVEKNILGDLNYLDYYRYHCQEFLRFDCTRLTFHALLCQMKDGERTLADSLIDKGVFTAEAYRDELSKIAKDLTLDSNGHVVHAVDNVPVPPLGKSQETYDGMGWNYDDFFVAINSPDSVAPQYYTVDKATFTRLCQLSDKKITVVDTEMHNGKMYFQEYPAGIGNNQDVTLKSYDGKETVTEVLKDGLWVYWGDTDAGDMYVVTTNAGTGQLYFIDLNSGEVKKLFSEKTDFILVQEMSGRSGSTGLSGLFIRIVYQDDVHYMIYEGSGVTDSLIQPRKMEYTTSDDDIMMFTDNSADKTSIIFADNNSIIKIDMDRKIKVLHSFDQAVISPFEDDKGNLYVLTGSELGVIDNTGDYAVLVPERIMEHLDATKILDVDEKGNVKFSSEKDQGMQHFDIRTYVYGVSTERISLISFEPARSDDYIGDSRKELVEKEQKEIDALY